MTINIIKQIEDMGFLVLDQDDLPRLLQIDQTEDGNFIWKYKTFRSVGSFLTRSECVTSFLKSITEAIEILTESIYQGTLKVSRQPYSEGDDNA